MDDQVVELLAQAEVLSPEQREQLAELLLSSVAGALHADWPDELLARQVEADDDPAAMVDFEQAIAGARAEVAIRRAG